MSDFTTEDVKVEAEGVVTHGPGTVVIIITVFDGNTPLDEKGKIIFLDVFAEWLKDMTDEWVVEYREF